MLTPFDHAAEIAVRLVAAVVLGGIIGLERTAAGKAAGLRTHMLVALGACVFVLAPLEAGPSQGDLGRAVQGVAAGVGFIGAGTILKRSDRGEVEGLTTAASLWLAAAIGLAIGAGRWWIPVFTALLSLMVLSLVGRLQRRIERLTGAGGGAPAQADETPRP